MTGLRISILGPVEVVRDGLFVSVSGSRVRRLLTRLALDAGRPVGPEALADAVWGADVPGEVPNALQSLASRLRRALGDPALVVTTPVGGYRLAVMADVVDALRFGELAGQAHSDPDPATVVARADTALELWRGAPLADLDPSAASADLARLDGLRRRLIEDRAEALLRLGDPDRVERDLGVVFTTDPTAERVAALLMQALTAAGRPAEALAVFERARAALADGFGTDPSPALQRQHLAVLRAEPDDVPAARSNLPAPVTSFVGRADDLDQLGRLLRSSRLVTLVGPGGAGKTRLAVEAGRLARGFVPDGVWMVELARVTQPDDVVTAVIDALGAWDVVPLDTRVRRRSGPAERLVDALDASAALLVLDNCEHVLDSVAVLAENLLAACPRLRILATSREPLALTGESLYPVPPLAHDTSGRSLAQLVTVPAVILFADRVRSMSPTFSVSEVNAEAVGRICERLDGLPLALELAAARCRTLPVEQVAERLGDRFRLLTGGSRTALPRHRTLRAVVEWSWDLLTAPERELAERLAVFPAGVDADAVRDVVARAGIDGDADDLVAALVDKSLLQLADGARYRMLETIREFGTDRLADRHELATARRQHAEYYLAFAREMEPRLRSREQLGWIARAVRDRDNFLSALQLLCDGGQAEDAVGLAVSLTWLWTLRGEHTAVVTWLRRALDVPSTTWTPARTVATGLLAMNLGAVAGIPAARRLAQEHRELLLAESGADDDDMLVLVRALVAVFLSETTEARTRIDRSLALEGLSGWARSTLLMVRAYAEENDGDIAAMRASMTAAAQGFEAIGERFGLSSTLEGTGRLQTLDGDLVGAIDSYTRSGRMLAELGAEDDAGRSAVWVATLQQRLGRLDEAEAAITLARNRFDRLGSRLGLVLTDCVASSLARERGDFATAAALAGSAEDRSHELGESGGPGQMLALCALARAYAALGQDAPDRAADALVRAQEAALGAGDMPVVAFVVVAQATLAERLGDRRRAAVLLGAADAIRGSTDATDLDVRRLEAALGGDPDLQRARTATAAAGREKALTLLPTGGG